MDAKKSALKSHFDAKGSDEPDGAANLHTGIQARCGPEPALRV